MAEEERVQSAERLKCPSSQLSWWSVLSTLSWIPPPATQLIDLENKILSKLKQKPDGQYVNIGADRHVWTVSLNAASPATPLVLLHGLGAGVGLWALNLDALATHRPVYALDLLGFGRSSRPVFSEDAAVAEMEMVEALEAWRRALCLDHFLLLGHCFGGFLATSYALRYPDRIRHLLLADPWGFHDARLVHVRQTLPMPMWVKMVLVGVQPFNPFASLRLAGAWGPKLVARFKPDLINDYSSLFTDDTISQYIYHHNVQNPTGETAFKHMSHDFGWAIYPMIHRIKDLSAFVSITAIFGSRSWVDSALGQKIKEDRPESYVDVEIIRGAGHFLFADKPALFNSLVVRTCTLVDHRLDVLKPPLGSLRHDRRHRRLKSESAPDLQTFDVARLHAKRLRAGGAQRNSECMPAVEERELDDGEAADGWGGQPPRPRAPTFVISDED